MPVDFLTEEQEQRYGRFAGDPSPEQLEKYFHFDAASRELIARRRGDPNRLGFAVQLGTVRFLGAFVPNVADVPAGVVRYVASSLGVDPRGLPTYWKSETRWDHTVQIRVHFGYRDFTDRRESFRFLRWLYTRTWVTSESPSMLFDLATAWLVDRKVLLPGVTVLARLVARVRDRAADRLWKKLSATLTPMPRRRLETLLSVEDCGRQTRLDRLRRAPTRPTAMGLVGALERLREVRALGVHPISLAGLPPGRVAQLARFANSARAQAIQRMPHDRRAATLLALAHTLARTACDDVLDIFDDFMLTAFGRAERRGLKGRVRTLPELDRAALQLREAWLLLLDRPYPKSTRLAAVLEGLFERFPRSEIEESLDVIGTLASPPDGRYYERILKGYPNLQKFLPLLLETVPFASTSAGDRVLKALAALPKLHRRRRVTTLEKGFPSSTIPASWRRLVFPAPGKLDRHAYTFCLVDELQQALHRRDVFVNESTRWGDPRRLLLEGKEWETERPRVCRALHRDPTPQRAIDDLAAEVDRAYRRTAANMASNPAVRVERARKRDTLVLTPLDALPDPPSLVALRESVHALLPRLDLPDLLLEVATWTHFPSEFRHASEGLSRIDDLETSLCAVLLAQACNVGLEPLVRPSVPALTRARLSWVEQNYVRAETIARANARLVAYQTKIALARAWGGGEVASADGLRFTVPVRTINARPNPRYFGVGRGVTYYNFSSNQFTGFHGIVFPGTLRDSLYILDGLLQHQTSLRPTQLMTDTAGYSDLVFGLFWLLGFQFSPRLADLGDARLWRMDRSANYGPLDGVACQSVNTKLLADNWDDMLRVAGSLLSGKVAASEIIRALQAGGRHTTLARAIAQADRATKTLHLLAYIDDENYRRRILIQLNHQEARHSLARALFYGQRGELRQPYREGQEDQLGALGLVLNAIVLWNTRYMDAALASLRAQGGVVRDEDLEHLSPLGRKHINLLGRYHFAAPPDTILRGELRPLRDPEDPVELLNESLAACA